MDVGQNTVYGNPRSIGSSSTAPMVNPVSHQHQSRQDEQSVASQYDPNNNKRGKDIQRTLAHRPLKPLLVQTGLMLMMINLLNMLERERLGTGSLKK